MPDAYTEWLGVPDGPRPPTHYQLLGLPPLTHDPAKIGSASGRLLDRLRAAYADRSRPELLKLIREVDTAREVLLDPLRRREYDDGLDGGGWWEAAEPEPAPPKPKPAEEPWWKAEG